MAGSLNKVQIIGNVGADPEIRRTQDGRPIANLRIATSETWRDKSSGERKEKTEWHSVVIYTEGLCKVVEQYVKKVSKLYVEGALQTTKWTDRENVDRYKTEIVLKAFNGTLTLLDSRGDGNGGGRRDRDDDRGGRSDDNRGGDSRNDRQRSSQRNDQGSSFSRDMDDDIPF